MKEGLLPRSGLKDVPPFPEGKVQYRVVTEHKETLLRVGYQKFKGQRKGDREFESFCQANAHWVEDYTLFTVLKSHFGGRGWNRCPKEIRDRKAKRMELLKEKFRDSMEMEKFFQYLFSKQRLILIVS
jgi:4-alpha-glucanotransferase